MPVAYLLIVHHGACDPGRPCPLPPDAGAPKQVGCGMQICRPDESSEAPNAALDARAHMQRCAYQCTLDICVLHTDLGVLRCARAAIEEACATCSSQLSANPLRQSSKAGRQRTCCCESARPSQRRDWACALQDLTASTMCGRSRDVAAAGPWFRERGVAGVRFNGACAFSMIVCGPTQQRRGFLSRGNSRAPELAPLPTWWRARSCWT